MVNLTEAAREVTFLRMNEGKVLDLLKLTFNKVKSLFGRGKEDDDFLQKDEFPRLNKAIRKHFRNGNDLVLSALGPKSPDEIYFQVMPKDGSGSGSDHVFNATTGKITNA